MNEFKTGAIAALLDEYRKAIDELKQVITKISDSALNAIVDEKTPDENCKSISTILGHVVQSGYSYAINIRNLKGAQLPFREVILRPTYREYLIDLDDLFNYTSEAFLTIANNELEEFDASKKILSRWGQVYDIEQMMEHAIVHILRHRRQIEKFWHILQTANK